MEEVMNVEFEYELEDNILIVEATVTRGQPARLPDMNGPGEPAEEPTIEIGGCWLKGVDNTRPPFDPDGLWFRPWAKAELRSVLDDMEDKAWEAACEQWGET